MIDKSLIIHNDEFERDSTASADEIEPRARKTGDVIKKPGPSDRKKVDIVIKAPKYNVRWAGPDARLEVRSLDAIKQPAFRG